MAEQRTGIIAECVCDLPQEWIEEYGIDIVYFVIETDHGVFTDTDEITAGNIFEYVDNGGEKTISSAPSPEVYRRVFEKNLERYEELVLVAISDKVSASCANARTAIEEMGEAGKRVHVFDSEHLSTGLGHMVLRAAELARGGAGAEEIIKVLSGLRERVSSSFITQNANYLYRKGFVSRLVRDLSLSLSIHPVLALKNGHMKLQGVELGNYEKACRRYVRKALKKANGIDRTLGFLTHAACNVKTVEGIKKEIAKQCPFETLTVTKASATVSSNCGPNALGVLFVRKESAT